VQSIQVTQIDEASCFQLVLVPMNSPDERECVYRS
jgi:hypothetical protein